MKKILAAFLIMVFILPALGPWMPHDALQVLHVQKEKHHASDHHHGSGHAHEAGYSHSIHYDAVTYFKDYLHVDLKHSDVSVLKAPSLDKQAADFMMVADISPSFFSDTSIQTTGPPPDNWRLTRTSLPVYRATQRLRI